MRYIVSYIICILGLTIGLCHVNAQSNVDTKIAVNSQTDDKTFVIIISNENYKHEESVPFARNDGEVFKVYCQKTLGIPESNIRFVPDATLNEMNFEIDWLDDVLRAYEGEARAIFYYTGHGMPDESSKEAYLLPIDGYSKSPQSGLSTKKLYQKLGKMQTQSIVVFMDACFSGAKRDGKMLASSRGVAIKAKDEPVGNNTVVFSAAQGDETAYPYKSQQHGMFTYYVLEKLQQSGGATTLGELSQYVTQQVKRKSVVENGKSQTPSVTYASNNQNWRDWQFASTAAKKYETRVIAATAKPSDPHQAAPTQTTPKQAVSQQPTQSQVTTSPPVQSASTSKSFDESETADLINQGKKAMRAMNYESARKTLLQAANQGSLEACYQLGLLYSNSNFDSYSRETATTYFLKAANTGHVEAMYQTGMMYLGSDNATAKLWLRKASDKGHQRAKVQLSKLR
jgi:hypothetical protein